MISITRKRLLSSRIFAYCYEKASITRIKCDASRATVTCRTDYYRFFSALDYDKKDENEVSDNRHDNLTNLYASLYQPGTSVRLKLDGEVELVSGNDKTKSKSTRPTTPPLEKSTLKALYDTITRDETPEQILKDMPMLVKRMRQHIRELKRKSDESPITIDSLDSVKPKLSKKRMAIMESILAAMDNSLPDHNSGFSVEETDDYHKLHEFLTKIPKYVNIPYYRKDALFEASADNLIYSMLSMLPRHTALKIPDELEKLVNKRKEKLLKTKEDSDSSNTDADSDSSATTSATATTPATPVPSEEKLPKKKMISWMQFNKKLFIVCGANYCKLYKDISALYGAKTRGLRNRTVGTIIVQAEKKRTSLQYKINGHIQNIVRILRREEVEEYSEGEEEEINIDEKKILDAEEATDEHEAVIEANNEKVGPSKSIANTVKESNTADETVMEKEENVVKDRNKPTKQHAVIRRKPHTYLDVLALTDNTTLRDNDIIPTFPTDSLVFVDNLPVDITNQVLFELYSRLGKVTVLQVFNQRPDLDPGPLTSLMLQTRRKKQMRSVSFQRGKWERPRTPLYAILYFPEDATLALDNSMQYFGMIVDRHSVRSIKASKMTTLYIERIANDITASALEEELCNLLRPDFVPTLGTRQNGRAVIGSAELRFDSFESAWIARERIEQSELKQQLNFDVNWLKTPRDAEKWWTRKVGFD